MKIFIKYIKSEKNYNILIINIGLNYKIYICFYIKIR